jgi:heterodisulfide reductase subunit C
MEILSQVLFCLALGVSGYLVLQRVNLIRKTIRLGKADDRSDRKGERLSNMVLLAFGQKKMFTRPVVGILHFLVYIGFVLINIELLEIIIDGIFGTHRVFSGLLGRAYPYLLHFFEVLAFGVLAACVVFLIRRNVVKVERLQADRHPEMRGWASLDANIILTLEILLMTAFLSMNAADYLLQTRGVGHFAEVQTGKLALSQFLVPLLAPLSDSGLIAIERFMWWFHILGILFFTVYLTYSKHLHIVLAFPNTYFSDLEPKGKMHNMPAVANEVQIMLGLKDAPETPAEIGGFGAKDVYDLSWKSLMDAYSCTECGRCTSSCPANLTGKALSPRKIMTDTRDRLEDIQRTWKLHGEGHKDDKSLLGDYITDEEILACTSCNACVQECPVMINPLSIIQELRRFRVMEESKAPQSWNMMFQNLETAMSPWKFSPDQRTNWVEKA